MGEMGALEDIQPSFAKASDGRHWTLNIELWTKRGTEKKVIQNTERKIQNRDLSIYESSFWPLTNCRCQAVLRPSRILNEDTYGIIQSEIINKREIFFATEILKPQSSQRTQRASKIKGKSLRGKGEAYSVFRKKFDYWGAKEQRHKGTKDTKYLIWVVHYWSKGDYWE